MKGLIAALLFSLASVPALAADAGRLADPAQEARARALQRELRCLVCQGESLDESQAPLAADLRALIREQIGAGKSDAAIKNFLVARYGDFILMKPPVRGDTYVLWFGPALLLLAGGAVVWLTVARAKKRALAGDSSRLP